MPVSLFDGNCLSRRVLRMSLFHIVLGPHLTTTALTITNDTHRELDMFLLQEHPKVSEENRSAPSKFRQKPVV